MFCHMIDQYPVKVIPSEHGITIGGFYLKNSISKLQNRDVKSTASKVIYDDSLILMSFVQPVSECGSSRLVDDSFDFQSGYFSGLLCGLSLRIIEVGRYRYYCFSYFLT